MQGRTDVRTSRLAALYVSEGNSPTPFLEPGPFESQWEGWLAITGDSDDFRFYFEGTGYFEMSLDGSVILQQEGSDGRIESDIVHLEEGSYELRMRYRSPQSGPARMRLLWSGSSFTPEPVSYSALSYDATDSALSRGKQLRRGRELIARYSCLKCHQPEDPAYFDEAMMPELGRDAPDLSGVGSRLRANWLHRFLMDPHALRESSKMPRMGLDTRDAADITAWLITLGEAPERHEEEVVLEETAQVARGGRLFASQGCVACHSLSETAGNEDRLSLAGVANKWYVPALAEYLLEPSRHYAWTEMPDFQLDERQAAALTAYLISETDPGDGLVAYSERGDADRGKRLVSDRGCVSCHAAPAEDLSRAPSLETLLEASWQPGWLGDDSLGSDHPSYPGLNTEDRKALRALADGEIESLRRYSPIEFAGRQIKELDCRACHEMDGRGDRWSTLSDEVAHLLPDNEEIPFSFAQRRPALTWAGEKLQPEWFERLLAGTQEFQPRPWLEARMPAIGAEPNLMTMGLLAMHGVDNKFEHIQSDPDLISAGRTFARGLGNGFFCQSCHHGGAGGGFPAPDLALLGERLQPDFFYWMMHSPRRVDSQTAMPEFADAEGRTRHLDRFDGDAQKQFEAIWHYLVDSRAGRVTDGEDVERDAGTPWAELYQQMDTGPFYSGVIDVPEYDPEDLEINPVLGYVTNVPTEGHIPKGLSIRVGDRKQATIHFDHDLLIMRAAWSGDFLEFRSPHDRGIRNVPPPAVAGKIWFANPDVAGWSAGQVPSFDDPRDEPFGPVPEEHGHYNGLYLHGDRTILSYSVAGTPVLESPWYIEERQMSAFVRDLQVGGHEEPISLLLFDPGGDTEVNFERQGALQVARVTNGDGLVKIAAVNAENESNVQLVSSSEGYVSLRFDPRNNDRSVRVLMWEGEPSDQQSFLESAAEAGNPEDLERLTEPGPARWGDPLITQGELGESVGTWAVDRVTAPLENPYNALLNFTDVDFLDDGRAVLTTMHGDVWLVGGIDESLERLEWQRYATGLNHPFGVRVVDNKIYVSTDDELLILHDRNGNDEADYYESFSNLIAPPSGAWRHAFGLEVDSEGNFYYARGRGVSGTEWENGVYRISPDGRVAEQIATGFRQPWGMGISPDGLITVSQQEGTWVPQTPINKIDPDNRKGSFYGFNPNRFRSEDPYPRDRGFEPPLVWLPRNVDNSGAGQVWVDSDVWGLPRGQMLHMAYAHASILQVMYEQVEGEWQGGVVPVATLNDIQPRNGRFHPQDGQLYVAGLSPGGFERVRYTGGAMYLPVGLYSHENGLRIRFAEPLNRQAASEIASYHVHRWNYRWSDDYGSGYYSVKNPELYGEDPVEVISVSVLDNGREVFLEIPDMVPVDQMRIRYELEAADGMPIQESIYSTVNALRPAFNP
jgi:mono/diheme cytochrome c family protein